MPMWRSNINFDADSRATIAWHMARKNDLKLLSLHELSAILYP